MSCVYKRWTATSRQQPHSEPIAQPIAKQGHMDVTLDSTCGLHMDRTRLYSARVFRHAYRWRRPSSRSILSASRVTDNCIFAASHAFGTRARIFLTTDALSFVQDPGTLCNITANPCSHGRVQSLLIDVVPKEHTLTSLHTTQICKVVYHEFGAQPLSTGVHPERAHDQDREESQKQKHRCPSFD